MKVKIERVTKFKYKYLGSQISSSFDDITERTNAAYRTFWKMMKIWKSKDIKEEIKIKLKYLTVHVSQYAYTVVKVGY